MITVLLGILIVLLSVAGLATGILFGRAPLKGSCGGLACPSGIDCATCTHSDPEQER